MEGNLHSPHINDLAGHQNIKLNQNKLDLHTSPKYKSDVMHNTRLKAIEKHLNSCHVENMILHDFLQTNHAPSFIRDTCWRVGELKYSRGKISLISNYLIESVSK